MEELRKAACRVGAHAMYGFSEAVRADYNYVSATFGVHDAIVTHRPIRDAPAKTPAAAGGGGQRAGVRSDLFARLCLSGRPVPAAVQPALRGGRGLQPQARLRADAGQIEPARAPGT